MNTDNPPPLSSSTWGKLGLTAGAVACVLPLPLFGLRAQELTRLEEGVLFSLFAVSMAVCSLVASRRPWLGVLVLPPCFFALATLACWYFTAARAA